MNWTETSAERVLSSFSSERARLFDLLLKQSDQAEAEIAPQPRSQVDGRIRLPLSWAQERLWFIDQMEGAGAAYNIQIAIRLTGHLDELKLRAAFAQLIHRHEALRTVFVSTSEGPRQEITSDVSFELKRFDLSTLEPSECERQVRAHKIEEAQRVFDLRRGPLLRGRLLKSGASEHVLLITLHHIVSDGWSMAVFARELQALYAAACEARAPSLPELPVQYVDYAQWQKTWLRGRRLEAQLDYWRTQLEGATPELELPLDHVRPRVMGYRGRSLRVSINSALTDELNAFARSHGVTLFMVLHAAWALLLARLTGQQDILIGTPVANRSRPELEGLIGFFVNTLVLRVPVDGRQTLREFVRQVKDVALGAYEHQDVPFEKVVEAVRPQRALNRHPIFQVMFALQSAPQVSFDLPGLTATLEDSANEAAKFDLLLSLQERGGEIAGSLNYDIDLFDEDTVRRWIDSYVTLLADFTGNEARPVDSLAVLPDSERRQVIEGFNADYRVFPTPHLIHELFEEQVRRAPQAVAVTDEGRQLSYAELNQRANQLARHLRCMGVGTGELIGISVERGQDLVVGLLGILKAGGAYVPLDPSYPAERIAWMVEDAAPRVIVTQGSLRDRLPDTKALRVALDEDWNEIATQPAEDLDPQLIGLSPRHLAYVIYTSGSTGRPKGVMVEHRNVTRLFAATAHWFEFGGSDVWTLFHSFAFDFSVWELWGALLYGGRLVVVPHFTARAPHEFYRLLCEQGVTVLNQTPSAFAQLIDAQARNTQQHHRLRLVIFGGEALELHTLRPWIRRNGARTPQLVNMYGITETTVHVTYRPPLTEQEIEAGRRNLVGRPIPDLRAYLLDRHGQPVPIGVAGEIHVGGAGVARGYLNRPALTCERFPADPFASEPAARMYKSGDLGRWRPDGTIEYLGRNDHQVKIRGFRIELGEIENRLTLLDAVTDAVVIAREDSPGDKRLVAYIVAKDQEAPPNAETLRAHLKATLPEHMVPGAFIVLASLPLTPNGKLDRRALPAPGAEAFATHRYEAPVGEVEEMLASVWRTLLRVERVGRQDNFFELGGHSLLIVQMMERLRALGLSVEVRSVFESPTLAELASVVVREAQQPIDVATSGIPESCSMITPDMLPLVQLESEHIERITRSVPGGVANIQDIYPLTPLQEGILFHHLLNDQSGDVYVIPVLLSVASRARLNDLIAALQEAIDRHDVLRTAILWDKLPRPVQVVQRRASLPVEEALLDPARDTLEQVTAWIRQEAHRIDLTQAPLLHLRVAPGVGGQWYALLKFHHIVDDATSMKLLIGEIVARLEGREPSITQSVPYKVHVARALDYLRTHDPEAFFRQKLGSIAEPTAPFGLSDVHGDGMQIHSAARKLDPALAGRVRIQARRCGVSVATMFHAAWGLVVARTTARDDVVFGTVLLGRMQGAGVSHAMGMFINTLPLRLQLKGLSARQLVDETQRELVALLEHEQAPLVLAQRCSAIEGTAPLFSALLNFRHNVTGTDSRWSAARGIEVVAGAERTNYPITASVDDLGSDFRLTVYTDRRIDGERLVGYTCTALESLVESLERAFDTPVVSLAVIAPAEVRELLAQFNATEAAFDDERLVHEMVERQVAQTPEAIAVVHHDRCVSYGELNARANQLARALIAKGADVERRVGVCMERGIDMVVALLAVLKAGAAYVPLDPNYPADRLTHMMQDAALRLLVTERRLQSVLPASSALRIVVDEEEAGIAGASSDDLRVHTQSDRDSLVYVIYTSGSTGRPKGTAMSHGAMVNLLQWHRRELPCHSGERVLQFAALSFDVAFQEIFSTLSGGGTLVLVDEWVRRDAPALLELLRRDGVERLFVPPLMLQSLAEHCGAHEQAPHRLRQIITAGEQLRVTPEIVSLFEKLEGCELHNHYGPTETHVVTALTLTGDPRTWPALPSIGRPIANTRIYILDGESRPTPMGVTGEIYIGGANLASGYLNKPELTAQRFIRDPFTTDVTARLYKTGDLGRWRADGTIEYLGRNDHQVKIRGYRIELGEVEAQLALDPRIKEAAVIAREDAFGHKSLAAYVSLHEPQGVSTEELRQALKQSLPEYMVPGALMILDALPVNPNGKLDRRALPAIDTAEVGRGAHEPPVGEIETTLAAIWQELLQTGALGRDDNFFDLGAHSLLVLKALSRINQAFSRRIRVKEVYRNPTVRELAAFIAGAALEEDVVDLAKESALDERIVALAGAPRIPPQRVLLTGATGFVGRFLLAQLLRDTDATLYCLVRAASPAKGWLRLKRTLDQWGLWSSEFESRIVAVPGDLCLPRLGIAESTYEALSSSVDAIYHCATSMNHLETYQMAKRANVDSARELLRLATSKHPKLLNYISTLGVFGGEAARRVEETTPIDFERHLAASGYAASKWVGEKIFMRAAERGIPCNIFRVGLAWADSVAGRYDEAQREYMMLKTSLLLGRGIQNYRCIMVPTPVDYIARAIVGLANQPRAGLGVFHIAASDEQVGGLYERINELGLAALELCSFHEWIQEVRRCCHSGITLPVAALMEHAFSMDEAAAAQFEARLAARALRFDCEKTYAQQAALGIAPPVFSDAHLRVCVEGMLARDEQLQAASASDGEARLRSYTARSG